VGFSRAPRAARKKNAFWSCFTQISLLKQGT
jgi:hypothetical protein